MQHHVFRYQLQYKSKLNGPIKALLVVSGLFTFAFGMFSPIYALFVETIGEDITVAANAWAVFSLTAGLLTFITGRWENKIKETEFGIVWSQFVIGFAYVLYLAQAILGAGMALFWPAFHATYGKHTTKDEAAWQWSLYDGLAYLLPAVAAVAGGELAKAYGFGTIFIIMAILSFICGLFVLILPRKVL